MEVFLPVQFVLDCCLEGIAPHRAASRMVGITSADPHAPVPEILTRHAPDSLQNRVGERPVDGGPELGVPAGISTITTKP